MNQYISLTKWNKKITIVSPNTIVFSEWCYAIIMYVSLNGFYEIFRAKISGCITIGVDFFFQYASTHENDHSP